MNTLTADPYDHVYQRDSSIVAREIAGETILIPIRKCADALQNLYLLNETGNFAFQYFDGKHTLGDIRLLLTQEYDVNEIEAGQDLQDLVDQLLKVEAILRVQ